MHARVRCWAESKRGVASRVARGLPEGRPRDGGGERDLEAESGEKASVGALDQAPHDLLPKPLHPGRDFWQDGPELLLCRCQRARQGARQRA